MVLVEEPQDGGLPRSAHSPLHCIPAARGLRGARAFRCCHFSRSHYIRLGFGNGLLSLLVHSCLGEYRPTLDHEYFRKCCHEYPSIHASGLLSRLRSSEWGSNAALWRSFAPLERQMPVSADVPHPSSWGWRRESASSPLFEGACWGLSSGSEHKRKCSSRSPALRSDTWSLDHRWVRFAEYCQEVMHGQS